MKKWSATLFLFNLIDAVATSFVLTNGIDVEYNPLVRYLYGVHPVAFFVIKLSLLIVAISVAIANTSDQKVRLTFKAVTVFYGALALYQIAALAFWRFSLP